MAEGCDQKNVSTQPSRVVTSHRVRKTIATTSRRPATFSWRRRASRLRLATRSTEGRWACAPWLLTAKLRCAALLTLIAHEHLVLEVLPDLFVDFDKALVEPDLGDVARARQVYLLIALDRARPGGDHENAVAERDRLLQVVGHEYDRG